jgi:O2-independent ubiquinone biosynthesis accessory factor UbiT
MQFNTVCYLSPINFYRVNNVSTLSLNKLPLAVKLKLLQFAPKIAKPVGKLMPHALQKYLLINALSSIFSEALADGEFEFLQDKWLKISILDLDLNWWLSFDGVQLIMAEKQQQPKQAVSFSANGDDLLLIAGRKQDPDTLFFQRRLKIEGDTELGLALKNLIDAVELDTLPSNVHALVEGLSCFIEQTNSAIAANG